LAVSFASAFVELENDEGAAGLDNDDNGVGMDMDMAMF
jgi:hypothetical protein